MKAHVYTLVILGAVLISGCQNFFTYSPLDILERDPDTLSKDQKLLYARQALSSGNKHAMEEALDVVVNDLIPDDPTDADLNLLWGDLMWTLSDAPLAVLEYLNDNDQTFPDPGITANFPVFVNDILGQLTTDEILLFQGAALIYFAAENDPQINAVLNVVQQLATGMGLLSTGDPLLVLIANTYIADAINALAI